MSSNLPDGVSESMIPGNRPGDVEDLGDVNERWETVDLRARFEDWGVGPEDAEEIVGLALEIVMRGGQLDMSDLRVMAWKKGGKV